MSRTMLGKCVSLLSIVIDIGRYLALSLWYMIKGASGSNDPSGIHYFSLLPPKVKAKRVEYRDWKDHLMAALCTGNGFSSPPQTISLSQ